MNNIITAIAERIKAEHRKHPDIDWEYIAASKIYQSFIDDVANIEHKCDNTDTLFDTTNKNEDTVSNIIHNSDSEPSVNDKIIIDTEVYYTCLKDNKWFKKNNQIGFKEIPELPNMMEVNILNGSRFFLKSCAIKQMIANREIDTPF